MIFQIGDKVKVKDHLFNSPVYGKEGKIIHIDNSVFSHDPVISIDFNDPEGIRRLLGSDIELVPNLPSQTSLEEPVMAVKEPVSEYSKLLEFFFKLKEMPKAEEKKKFAICQSHSYETVVLFNKETQYCTWCGKKKDD